MAKKKRPAAALEDDASAGPSSTVADSSVSPKFGQMLASNDTATRNKAVKALSRYLKSGRVTEELELTKIWKALFYCMWHSDKPKVQAELAERLGGLMRAVPGNRAALFAKVFWATMMREWVGIDRLRLNKFYTLQRCVLQQSFLQLRLAGWPAGGVEALAQVLRQGPLSSSTSPAGLRYWLLDNYVPALRAELKTDTSADVWMALLEPLFHALGAAPDPHSLKRTSDGTVKALLAMRGGKAKDDDDDSEDDDGAGGDDDGDEEEEVEPPPGLPIELAQLAERLFGLASNSKTREANRQHLYALQEKVEQLSREAGGGSAKAAPVGTKPAKAKAADPAKVSSLLKLIGGKAGAATAKQAPPVEEEPPKPTTAKKKRRVEAAADEEAEEEATPAPKAVKASKTAAAAKKKRRVEAAADEAEEEATPAPKAIKASKTAAAAAGEGTPKKKTKVVKAKADLKGKL